MVWHIRMMVENLNVSNNFLVNIEAGFFKTFYTKIIMKLNDFTILMTHES